MLVRFKVAAVALGLALLSPGTTVARLDGLGGAWQETRFWTGCDPGPFHLPPWPDPRLDRPPSPQAPQALSLQVDLDSAASHRPILGTGFNFEHALWSCPAFRGVLRSEILDPFRPALARVDSGLLPAAPASLATWQLGSAVYRSMLESPPYASSWRFFHRLERDGIRVLLGVWGGPDQFTDDGTRRGRLLPRHYDDYVEYVVSLVDFLVRRQGVDLWATTVANEPDGGDGNQIPADGYAYIARRLAERLTPYGVKLYGPDTASGANALDYLPGLLDDPLTASSLAAVGFHEYEPSPDVGMVVDVVRRQQPDLPVIITEYTSFGYGDLDDGQEISGRLGFTLTVVEMLLSHYANGADGALYWDAVDYLQPGHDAITKWGLLRGPAADFARRKHYYGLGQVLRHLQPGSRVLDVDVGDGPPVGVLAIRTPDGQPAVFLVNKNFTDVELDLTFSGRRTTPPGFLVVTRTGRQTDADVVGRLRLVDGAGSLTLPARSVTTLASTGTGNEDVSS